jgi:hypothetical protein
MFKTPNGGFFINVMLSHLPTSSLDPGLFGTFHLGNDNFPLPDSVPDTVMAGLDVRNVLIV